MDVGTVFTRESVKKDQVSHESGINGNVKDTDSEKLKCHQPAVRLDVLLLRNTCGAFLETSLPVCAIQAPRSKPVGSVMWWGSDTNCSEVVSFQ